MSTCNLGLFVPVHVNLPGHPKFHRLCRLLDISDNKPAGIGLLVLFWSWVLQYFPDGNLDGATDSEIETSVAWKGETGKFVQSLESSGFISRNGTGEYQVNSWEDYGGKLIVSRMKNAEKQRRYREKKDTLPLRNGYVTVQSTVHKSTVHNTTEENRTEEEDPPYAPPEMGGCGEEPPSLTIAILPIKEKRKRRKRVLTVEQQARHDQFWAAYPRKDDPGDSEKAWLAIDPDQETFEKIMAAVPLFIQDMKNQGRTKDKIKKPSTWLRARAWESDYSDESLFGHSSESPPSTFSSSHNRGEF